MKKLVLLLVSGFIITGLTFAQDVKKDDGKIKGDSEKVTATRGVDKNIKLEKRKNSADMETKAVQPKDKGAAEARGFSSGYCDVTVDNYTAWYLDCYIDGYYEGYVGPWGSGEVTVGSGTTKVYVVALFDDGSKVTWGPAEGTCNDYFKMNIYETYYDGSVK